jgi:hypothetical protein
MKMFTNATVNTMSQASPGFAFANNMVRDNTPSMNMGPPPAPVETKSMPNMSQRAGNNTMNFMNPPVNRPDISMGRGASMQVPPPPEPAGRPEMRGPKTDIDNILSGLKTRTIDIHPPAPVAAPMSSAMSDTMSDYADDSVISIASLRDMQNTNMPKRSRKRNNGSNKNTISLDI